MTTTLRDTEVCGRAAPADINVGPTVRVIPCDRSSGHDGAHAFLVSMDVALSPDALELSAAWERAGDEKTAHVAACRRGCSELMTGCAEGACLAERERSTWLVYFEARLAEAGQINV